MRARSSSLLPCFLLSSVARRSSAGAGRRRSNPRNRFSDSAWAPIASSPTGRACSATSRRVAAASDRVDLVDAGPTTGGRRLIAAVVTAPENLARLEEIRLNSMRLSDPRTLDEAAAAAIVERQPVIVAIGMSIHATEIAATQAAPELLHTLATSNDPEVLRTLRDVVLILLSVAQSRRPRHHRGLVSQVERHRVRRRRHAVAVPRLRRPRHQPRRVHDEHGREPDAVGVLLPALASAGVPDDAPDGSARARGSSCRRTSIRSIAITTR